MRTVTVTGSATSRVAPDSAVVRVAAVARAGGVSEAYAAMTRSADLLVEVAVRHAPREHVASSGISLWPAHGPDGRREGYEARHAFTVRCAGPADAGAVLAELADEVGDALAVDGIGLEVTEDHGAAGKAREAAFHDARERAAALARMAGAGLGAVQSVVEVGAGDEPGVPRLAMVRESSGGVEPGEAVVTSVVTVVWELV